MWSAPPSDRLRDARSLHGKRLLSVSALALCAFLLTLRFNRFTIILAIPALAITIAYPFFKRFFALPQAFLGIAFSFGIPMAFAAVQGTVPATGWWLFGANFFWVMAYDTEYAMVDREDDRKLGLRTAAILFGRFDVPAVMLCLHDLPCAADMDRARVELRTALFRWGADRVAARTLALHVDPQARARRLLPRIPRQSLAGTRDLRRRRRRLCRAPRPLARVAEVRVAPERVD